MKTKSITAVVLLLFVAASIAYLVIKESRAGRDSAVNSIAASIIPRDQVSGHKIIAYYFHGTARCMTCRKIEAYTYETIVDGFSEALKSGLIEWHVINMDEPDNEHFVKDYQLVTQSVVLIDHRGGKQTQWKNLERVWELAGDRALFQAYIRDEIRTYLAGDG